MYQNALQTIVHIRLHSKCTTKTSKTSTTRLPQQTWNHSYHTFHRKIAFFEWAYDISFGNLTKSFKTVQTQNDSYCMSKNWWVIFVKKCSMCSIPLLYRVSLVNWNRTQKIFSKIPLDSSAPPDLEMSMLTLPSLTENYKILIFEIILFPFSVY